MREILPVANYLAREYIYSLDAKKRQHIEDVRAQKVMGVRPRPSDKLIDRSESLDARSRAEILNRVAMLVDENIFGRSEMCEQFADLLRRSLNHFGLKARGIAGTAVYYSSGKEIFRWGHAWVIVGGEVIDGNIDTLPENPFAPPNISIDPFWGAAGLIPKDRKLLVDPKRVFRTNDIDVLNIWWPELKDWLDKTIKR